MKTSARGWRAGLNWTSPGGEPHHQASKIVKLDQRTVRLAVRKELPLYQLCSISIVDGDGQCWLVRDATVHYLHESRGQKQISFRWSEPLGEAEVLLLTRAGLHDRRVEFRGPVALEVPAWPETTAANGVIPVQVIDLSSGGCCIKSPIAVPVGQRLLIRAWGENCPVTVVRLRVQWQQDDGEETLLGCAFTQRTGYAAMASIVGQDSRPQSASKSPARGR